MGKDSEGGEAPPHLPKETGPPSPVPPSFPPGKTREPDPPHDEGGGAHTPRAYRGGGPRGTPAQRPGRPTPLHCTPVSRVRHLRPSRAPAPRSPEPLSPAPRPPRGPPARPEESGRQVRRRGAQVLLQRLPQLEVRLDDALPLDVEEPAGEQEELLPLVARSDVQPLVVRDEEPDVPREEDDEDKERERPTPARRPPARSPCVAVAHRPAPLRPPRAAGLLLLLPSSLCNPFPLTCIPGSLSGLRCSYVPLRLPLCRPLCPCVSLSLSLCRSSCPSVVLSGPTSVSRHLCLTFRSCPSLSSTPPPPPSCFFPCVTLTGRRPYRWWGRSGEEVPRVSPWGVRSMGGLGQDGSLRGMDFLVSLTITIERGEERRRGWTPTTPLLYL